MTAVLVIGAAVLAGWGALAGLGAVVLGRAIARADREELAHTCNVWCHPDAPWCDRNVW